MVPAAHVAHKRVLTVGSGDPPVLGRFLQERLGLHEETARALLLQGAVHVAGKRCAEQDRALSPGTRVVVYLSQSAESEDLAGPTAADTAEPPRIIHEDADVLVAYKPAGLLVQPARAGGASLLSWLADKGRPSRLVHRLDRDVSGLVVLLREAGPQGDPAGQQRAAGPGDFVSQVRREYVAVVSGRPAQDRGEIRLRVGLPSAAPDAMRRVALPQGDPAGQEAFTEYRVEAPLPGDQTLLLLLLHTGRTHQLRVHLSAIGHPIVGDRLYGGAPFERLLLHAGALRFPHPRTGRQLSFTCPAPREFQVPTSARDFR